MIIDGEIVPDEVAATFKAMQDRGMEVPELANNPAEETQEAKVTLEVPEEAPEIPEVPETPEIPEKPKEEPKPREVSKTVPVSKYNKLRHELQELKKQSQEPTREPVERKNEPLTNDNAASEYEDLAEEYDVDPTFMSKLTERITKKTLANIPTAPTINQSQIEYLAKVAAEQYDAAQFAQEFSEVEKEFPQAKEHLLNIKELAYSEPYANTPLRAIALQVLFDKGAFEKGKKTAESSTPATITKESFDPSTITDDEVLNLSKEQLEAFVKYQVAKENGLLDRK